MPTEDNEHSNDSGLSFSKDVSRREFLKIAGIAGAAVGLSGGLGGALAACGGTEETSTTATSAAQATTTTAAQGTTTSASAGVETGREIKVGFVDPITGPIALFGVPGKWCVERWSEAVKDGLVCGDGQNHPVSIQLQDSQSDTNRAAQVAGDLITNGNVDFMMACASPDTVNPVADQSEALGCPCLSVDAPMEPYYFGRGGTPDKPFKWTWHLFWGLTEMERVYWDTWNGTPTNKKIAIMFPNDVDGNAYRDYFTPEKCAANGFTTVDPGPFQPMTEDFTTQIAQFKKEGCEVLSAVFLPPEMANFRKQSLQQGFNPKIFQAVKASLFPTGIEAMGQSGNDIVGPCWFHPTYPYKSSLTGETAAQLCEDFETRTKQQWTQPIMHYAAFEWVADVLKRTTNIDDKEEILKRVQETKADFICGPVDFTVPVAPGFGSKRQVPNVYVTPLWAGQWQLDPGGKWMYKLVVVANSAAPDLKVEGPLEPIAAS
ncbi:MAG: ABC transporter substrate-binding protein [Actinobacteria bacterium]|nr:ABC transporter substrate-binding protein [Actinomycetota bacterium]